jgi:hypothetical protein
MPKIVTKNRRTRRRASKKMSSGAQAIGEYADDAWSLAKRTASGLNQLRRFINIEEKYFDTTGSGQVDYNGLITCLSQTAQGLDLNNRIGDSIRLQHISFRADVTTESSALWAAVRVVIFRDNAQSGIAPTAANVLAATGSIHITDAMFNSLNLSRFSILHDEVLSVSNVANTQDFVFYDAPHNGHIRYLGTTAASASNGLGSLYVLLCSDRIATLPTVTWTSRIVYTDD